MNSSPYEQMIKAKRENYRNEIRKQDIGLKMSLKRQIIFEQTQNSMTLIESNFSKFLSTFKFMERYTDPKDVPNKVPSFFLLFYFKQCKKKIELL